MLLQYNTIQYNKAIYGRKAVLVKWTYKMNILVIGYVSYI